MSDKYYPELLLRVYFNWCKVHNKQPSFDEMQAFVFECLGNGHSDGIPYKKIKGVIINGRKNLNQYLRAHHRGQ